MRLLKEYRTANSPPVEGWQAQPDGVVVAYLHSPNCLHHQFMQMVGADHSPPVEGWQAQPDGVVVAYLNKLNCLRHIITQTIYRIFARYYVLIQRPSKPPVGADHSPPVEGWQAQPDGVVVAYLNKLNCLRHIITQTIYQVFARHYVLIQRLSKPPVGRIIPLLWRGAGAA